MCAARWTRSSTSCGSAAPPCPPAMTMRGAVVDAIDQLDAGTARVAWVDSETDDVVVDERKRAILLSFKLLDMVESSAGDFRYHDRMPLKTSMPGVRVPGAIVRWGRTSLPVSSRCRPSPHWRIRRQ